MGRMCPLQLQVNFNSGSYVTIPTTTHFFQWANRTHPKFNVLITLYHRLIMLHSNSIFYYNLVKLYNNITSSKHN